MTEPSVHRDSTEMKAGLDELLERVAHQVEALLAGDPSDLPSLEEFPAELLTLATRLFSASISAENRVLGEGGLRLTTTEAVTVASSLLINQDMNPFEFSMWHARLVQLAGIPDATADALLAPGGKAVQESE